MAARALRARTRAPASLAPERPPLLVLQRLEYVEPARATGREDRRDQTGEDRGDTNTTSVPTGIVNAG